MVNSSNNLDFAAKYLDALNKIADIIRALKQEIGFEYSYFRVFKSEIHVSFCTLKSKINFDYHEDFTFEKGRRITINWPSFGSKDIQFSNQFCSHLSNVNRISQVIEKLTQEFSNDKLSECIDDIIRLWVQRIPLQNS